MLPESDSIDTDSLVHPKLHTHFLLFNYHDNVFKEWVCKYFCVVIIVYVNRRYPEIKGGVWSDSADDTQSDPPAKCSCEQVQREWMMLMTRPCVEARRDSGPVETSNVTIWNRKGRWLATAKGDHNHVRVSTPSCIPWHVRIILVVLSQQSLHLKEVKTSMCNVMGFQNDTFTHIHMLLLTTWHKECAPTVCVLANLAILHCTLPPVTPAILHYTLLSASLSILHCTLPAVTLAIYITHYCLKPIHYLLCTNNM